MFYDTLESVKIYKQLSSRIPVEPCIDEASTLIEWFTEKETEKVRQKLDLLLKRINKRHDFHGSLLVAKKGKILYSNLVGYKDFRKRELLDEHSIFQLASVSKQFTAAAIMILYENKQIKLTDTVDTYFPGFPYKGVTIKNFLNHTGGLPKYFWVAEHKWNQKKAPSNSEMMALLETCNVQRFFKFNNLPSEHRRYPSIFLNLHSIKFYKMGKMTLSGQIVDVVAKRIFSGTLHIENGIITKVLEETVSESHYIIPGFVDAHVHVESSMLIPSEFARLAVCHGSVATISDPHEIGNVLGVDGVKYMINNGQKTLFKFHFGAPSCVPATTFETAGAEITVADVEELLAMPEIHYLTEMMNFPGVLFDDPVVLAKIQAAKAVNKPIDGHAPGLMGKDAEKYINAGISTDHECFTKAEALEKLKYGMKILIREGSAAKNFDELISLLDQYPDDIMFCSDDKHPNDLVEGHINTLAKRAVAKGCDVMNVLRATSYNIIKHYNMNVGLLQENDPADFCVVDNLTDFNVSQTYIDGVLVAEHNKTLIPSVNEQLVNNFNCSEIVNEQLKVPATSENVKVIEVEDGQLITKKGEAILTSKTGYLESDVSQDILKIVVVNRYFDAPPAVAFVKNYGLKQGALASCVAHDSHNIIAVGVSDSDIVSAINLVISNKGGVSLANGNEKLVLPLPVAGIMSEKDGYDVANAYEKLDVRSKELGVKLQAPYMTMSFCALLVIPELKLSDKGLFDGNKFEFTDLHN